MSFFRTVLANLVADAIVAGTVAAVVTLYAWWKFSGAASKVWKWMSWRSPGASVITAPIPSGNPAQRQDVSPFVNPLSQAERDRLVHFYEFVTSTRPWNGAVVRLDALTPAPQFSVVGFHDFITTNLTAYPENLPIRGSWRRLAALRRWIAIRELMALVMRATRWQVGAPTTVDEVLSNTSMANPVAVSVILLDRRGRVLVTQRSADLAVASGSFGASCSGTVSESDLAAPDPFISAATRELYEETGLTGIDLRHDEVVVPRQKMQPVVVLSGRISDVWEDHRDRLEAAEDRAFEADHFYALDISDTRKVARFIAHGQPSQTLAYQLWTYACEIHGADAMRHVWRKTKFSLAKRGWADSVELIV